MHIHVFETAEHLVDYSPLSFRVCRCGLLQVLKYPGWTDYIKIPVSIFKH